MENLSKLRGFQGRHIRSLHLTKRDWERILDTRIPWDDIDRSILKTFQANPDIPVSFIELRKCFSEPLFLDPRITGINTKFKKHGIGEYVIFSSKKGRSGKRLSFFQMAIRES